MSDVLRQELINKLTAHSEERRKSKECIYDRVLHNDMLQAVISDLSENLDE